MFAQVEPVCWLPDENSEVGVRVSVSMIAAAAVHAAVVATHAASSSAEATVATGTSGVRSFIATTVPSIVASVLPSGVTTTAVNAARVGSVTVPPAWDLLATFAGSLSGGLVAVRRKFDIMGVLTLAVVCGLGGGIIRDVLLQKVGIAALSDNRYLLVAVAAALVAFFFATMVRRLKTPIFYINAVSLGMFVVVGADKALRAGMTMMPAILLGVVTSVGGGVLRDLLSDEVPSILRPGALYSTAALVGSAVYVLSVSWLGVVKEFAAVFAIGLAIALRLLAVWRGWKGPVARDYTEALTNLPRRLLSFPVTLRGGRLGRRGARGGLLRASGRSAHEVEGHPRRRAAGAPDAALGQEGAQRRGGEEVAATVDETLHDRHRQRPAVELEHDEPAARP